MRAFPNGVGFDNRSEGWSMSTVPRMRVTWNEQRRRWEVWERYPNRQSRYHSSHASQREARATARAQARQDAKDDAAAAQPL